MFLKFQQQNLNPTAFDCQRQMRSTTTRSSHRALTGCVTCFLNTRTSMRHCFTAINRSTGQTTHAQTPGPDYVFTQADTRTQMHQNLFTLTKNISAPLTISLGSKHPTSLPQTFSGIAAQKLKLNHPCNSCTPNPNHTKSWWRWTESNRRPPACKAGALPIELHPRFCVFRFRLRSKLLRHRSTVTPNQWWAREDSNLRPHAYQACALTN